MQYPEPPFPVITTGLTVFIVLTYVFSVFNQTLVENWALSPASLVVNHEFSRLTTYPLIHAGFFHIFSNVIVLYYPLADFEKAHGSLHTAIVVNTLGAVLGIAYTIITYILVYIGFESDETTNTFVLGSSGWVFTFITVAACHRAMVQHSIMIHTYSIPTLFIPLIYLVLSAILIPSSSFLGHLVSIILGVIIFKKIFSLLTIPPFKILDKIESLEIFKYAIDSIFPSEYFVWTWEADIQSSRYGQNEIVLPLSNDDVTNRGGVKLGSNLESNV